MNPTASIVSPGSSALAKHYIGDEEMATLWLKRANRALGGAKPLESIDTELARELWKTSSAASPMAA